MIPCIPGIPGVKDVVLLHIIDATQYSIHGWTHEPERENARLLMEEKKKYLNEHGLEVVTAVDAITSGTMSGRILEIAEREKVSLTIMGSHQKTSMDTFLHGSVSYDLLHHMNTHVLVMRQNATVCDRGKTEGTCRHIFSKVLVPVDFTDLSREMLIVVRGMNGISELVLGHVVTEGENEQEIEKRIAHARNELAMIQTDLEPAGFRVTIHIRVGNSVEKIVSLADEEEVSLILMCAHKKNWIEKFLQDSTPFAVVRSATRPVMILRMG
jgi:nucleotide-binding universal stress UspA family protein